MTQDKNKLLARYLAHNGVRNTILENFHSGIFPSSKTGDFSDVKIISPYGEIPWKEVSRLSDKEMRLLMLDVEKNILRLLKGLPKQIETVGSEDQFYELLERWGFGDAYGVSWDLPKKFYKAQQKEIETLKKKGT